jgi:hypothetical protein
MIQMKMVGHQAIGQDAPLRFAAGFSQGFQKPGAVGIIPEDVFATIPAIDHVIDGIRVFQAQFSRHAQSIPPKGSSVNSKKVQLSRTDTNGA